MIEKIRIATRNSPLAVWQAQHIAAQLSQLYPSLETELVPMTTSGDRFLSSQTKLQSGKGLFVKELEEALLQNRADIAVHSMKDVPAAHPSGLGIVAITHRENPYDAFISEQYKKIEDLPLNATIGTSSLRRQSQLLAFRSDFQILSVRGNIQTRLNKLHTTPFDALILATAGLIRMKLQDRIQQIIPEQLMLPACGQGALGIECRLDDTDTRTYLAALNEPITALCVTTERQVNAQLGGNCHVPVAVFCQPIHADQIRLQAKVLSADGRTVLSAQSTGTLSQANHLAQDCAQQLFALGAEQLLSRYD
ncbi:MAG: hydroxymethylbilane synthase [Legionellaceae bacterium]|nr:hydroxymethylbilane synthase [Legionellaceae bacterium]MBP9775336.1 hydroxymethylbilane synthase [Legionellaceae bacterium]